MGLDFEYIYGQTPLSEEEKVGLLIKSITTERILENLQGYDFEIDEVDMKTITNLPGAKPFSDPDKWNF